jgi:hypothetical protein
MKVAIVSCVWKRPEVFEMFAKGVKHLIANSKTEFIVIISGSEGEVSKQMVEKHGFIYVEMPNDPLSVKANKPVLIAKEYNVDYVLAVGSDDVISPELMRIYEKHMSRLIDYIAVLDFYFYDTNSGRSSYWGGYKESYREGHACGAGRLMSKKLLEQWAWQPWEVKHSKVLDSSIQEKLKATPHTSEVFSIKEHGVFALDIKSSTNMTPFAHWNNTYLIDSEIIKKEFHYIFN